MNKSGLNLILICVIFFSVLGILSPAHAQTDIAPPGRLRVATQEIAPFIILQEDGSLTGFSVDLWEALAQELGIQFEWVLVNSVTEQLAAVRNGQADLAISAVSMTPEREQLIDFSHPFFDSGLRILTAANRGAKSTDIISAIFTPALLKILGIAVLSLLVMAHIIWLAERGSKPDMPKAYLPGIWEALWWSFSTIVLFEYGDGEKPRTVLKRVLAMLLVFISIIIIAQFTASITASLTVQQITSMIEGPADLPGTQIVTVDGSTAARYLNAEGLDFAGTQKIADAFEILVSGDADVVVFDAPVLEHFASHQGQGKVEVVGPTFQDEKYAIVLPINSELREPINEALLRLMQNGVYDRIYAEWFGEGN